MLQKIKKNKKLILIPVSVILAIAVVLGVVISDVNTTLAKATLPGVESIIIRNNNDNPYTILEVVPSYEDARLGYLIGGEEPTHDGKARSIKDMPSSAERMEKIKLPDPITSTGNVSIPDNLSEAVTFEEYNEYGATATNVPENTKRFEVRGSFYDAGASKGNYKIIEDASRFKYVGTPATHLTDGAAVDLFTKAIDDKNVFYTKYAVFNKKTNTEISGSPSGYSLNLKKIYEGSDPVSLPKNLTINVSGTDDDQYYYTGQYFVAKKVEFTSTSSFSLMSANPVGTAEPSVSPSVTPGLVGSEPTVSPTTGSEATVTPTVIAEPTSEVTATPTPDSTAEPTAEPTATPTAEPISPASQASAIINNSSLISSTTTHYMNVYGAAAVPTNVVEGDSIFVLTGNTYAYKGYVDNNKLIIDSISGSPEPFDDAKEYYIVTEADANSSQESLLYIDSVSTASYSIYKLETTYDVYPTGEYGTYEYLNPQNLDDLPDAIKNTHFYVAAADDLGYEYIGTNPSAPEYKYQFKADYSLEPLVDPIVYTGGFSNNEWFKKYVFDLDDSQIDDMIIDVKTVTYSELTEDLVNEADFIYFAGVNDSTKFDTPPVGYIGDINDKAAKRILSRVCSSDDGVPIVINRSLFLYNKVTQNDIDSFPKLVNLDKIVLSLIQENISIPSDTQWTDVDYYWIPLKDTIRGLDTATRKFTSGGYVNGNLFVFDDTDSRMLISNAFIKQDLFSEAERNAAENYKPILDEINSENFYLEVAGKTERISTDITPAAAFRYIINFGDHRNVTKTSLRVLDLEPYDFSKLADADRYKNLVNPSNGSKLETIDVIEEVDSICLDNISMITKVYDISECSSRSDICADPLRLTCNLKIEVLTVNLIKNRLIVLCCITLFFREKVLLDECVRN